MNKNETRAWEFFIRNWRFTSVIVATCFLVGIFGTLFIPKESDPEVNIPYIFVSTVMPGASAEDIEEFVTDPIEDELVGLEGLEVVSSSSTRGVSQVFLEFKIDIDVDSALLDVKDRIELAKAELPTDAEDPVVQKLNFADYPILVLSVAGPYDVVQLKSYAEEFKEIIERSAGVSRVEVSGGKEREVQVQVDKAALDRFGLSLRQVTNAISVANSNIPVGTIETAGENYMLRFEGNLESAEDVASVPVTAADGVPIMVRDLASVDDVYADSTTVSRLGFSGATNEPSVTMMVYKVTGRNEIQTVDGVWQRIAENEADILPEGVQIVTVEDNAEYIRNDLNGLVVNGLQTVLIVMVLLLIFVGWREALMPGLGIPLSFLITLGLLYAFGYNLNFLTLFSLILSLGIIVDSSIVVTQGIYRFRKQGQPAKQAALSTIRHFSLPLMAGTLTTVFAFLPMVLTSGIMGEYIKTIPITVTIVLLSSLFVALGILPAFAWKLLKKRDGEFAEDQPERPKHFRDRLTDWIDSKYSNLLDQFIARPKLRKRFFQLVVLAFIGALALPATGVVKTNMFPLGDEDRLAMYLEMPYGTPLEEMDLEVLRVEELLLEDNDVDFFASVIGGGGDHKAEVKIRLSEDRERSSLEFLEDYSETLAEMNFSEVSIEHPSMGPPAGSPVQVRITGESFEVLEELGGQIETYLIDSSNARDVTRNIKETNGEFVLSIDRAKASIYGVTATDVAVVLRNAIYGVTATSISDGADDIDVVVRYDLDPLNSESRIDQVDFGVIESLTIATAQGDIPVSSLVSSTYEGSRATIEHRNGDRVLIIEAYPVQGVEAVEVFAEIKTLLETIEVPDGYEVVMGGEQEDVEQSFRDMLMALLLGVLMIAGLLVWQFGSFRQPFFVLVTIPLALIGVFFGLLVLGMSLTFPGAIGIVALAGIVVNNAIILIDRINYNRKSGMIKVEAVREAAMARLQPILLTTITTVLGILPLTLSDASWGTLGVSIIFGLAFSTVLTLIVVPLLFIRFGEEGKVLTNVQDRAH